MLNKGYTVYILPAIDETIAIVLMGNYNDELFFNFLQTFDLFIYLFCGFLYFKAKTIFYLNNICLVSTK